MRDDWRGVIGGQGMGYVCVGSNGFYRFRCEIEGLLLRQMYIHSAKNGRK